MNKKVLIKKADRIPDKVRKAFNFQNSDGEPITSFSQKAIFYRSINRPVVDKLFEESHSIFSQDQERAWELNRTARNLWRNIIRESNKL